MWFSKGALQLWQKELGNRSFVGTILMDLSKTYDSIPHELLIAKLECCGLDRTSLGLMLDYLSNRKQSTKIGWTFSSWYETGIQQGSVLGALFFNIFINDLFFSFTKSEVSNFADDNSLYSCNKNLENIFSNAKWGFKRVLEWFRINSLKINLGKFQFMVLGTGKVIFYNFFIDGAKVFCSKELKLLGIIIENPLEFEEHIKDLCKKASYELYVLRNLK